MARNDWRKPCWIRRNCNEAQRSLPEASETVLAACAAYVVDVAYRAAEGQGLPGVAEDPIGHSRTHRHPYTHAVTTVLTESHAPDHLLTYAVTLPEIGEVRGTRRVGALRVTGLSPARPAPDTVQITLTHDYTAQMETEFEIADYLVTGQRACSVRPPCATTRATWGASTSASTAR